MIFRVDFQRTHKLSDSDDDLTLARLEEIKAVESKADDAPIKMKKARMNLHLINDASRELLHKEMSRSEGIPV